MNRQQVKEQETVARREWDAAIANALQARNLRRVSLTVSRVSWGPQRPPPGPGGVSGASSSGLTVSGQRILGAIEDEAPCGGMQGAHPDFAADAAGVVYALVYEPTAMVRVLTACDCADAPPSQPVCGGALHQASYIQWAYELPSGMSFGGSTTLQFRAPRIERQQASACVAPPPPPPPP